MQGRDEVYSEKIRAGKRTYFFDVRSTRSNDYYITITESKRRFNGRGYDKHKIFLYKEDFNKFLLSLNKTVDHVKTELLPDYDYDEFDRKSREYEAALAAGEDPSRRYDDAGSNDGESSETKKSIVSESDSETETGTDSETEIETDSETGTDSEDSEDTDTETSLSTSWED